MVGPFLFSFVLVSFLSRHLILSVVCLVIWVGYWWPWCMKVKVAQSCPTLWPHGLIHGILQARILEWVAIPFSRRFYRPRDWTQVSLMAGRLQSEPPGNPTSVLNPFLNTHLWLFFISISFFYKSLVWNICNSVLFSFYPDLCCSDLF